jgi:uncharacterized membrane-anchored protein YhcB (DUF1043 family)
MKMDKERIEELLINYIEGQLSGDQKAFVEAKVKEDTAISKMYHDYLALYQMMEDSPEEVPDDRLNKDFHRMLEREKQSEAEKIIPIKGLTKTAWFKVAAAVALIAIGFLLGRFWIEDRSKDPEIVALQQDLDETKALLQQVVNGHLSATQRLANVRVSYQLKNADNEILDVLVRTMNTDDNVNVRLAAIRGLAGFTEDQEVRRALIQSLESQNDPSIQMMLINILVKIKEKEAVQQFEKLIEDEAVDSTVKDEAQLGIFQLSKLKI